MSEAPQNKNMPPFGLVEKSQDGFEEFPVLRAFQQYIDAEQARARKRIIALSVFFVFMMVVVIAGFMTALTYTMGKNQNVSDKLIGILEERAKDAARQTAAPETPQKPEVSRREAELAAQVAQYKAREEEARKAAEEKAKAQAEADRKALLEKIERLSAEIAAVQAEGKANADKAKPESAKPEVPPPQPAQPAQTPPPAAAETARPQARPAVSAADASRTEKLLEQSIRERIRREEAEKRAHDLEVERNRRKLYPELYGARPKPAAAPAPAVFEVPPQAAPEEIPPVAPSAPERAAKTVVEKTDAKPAAEKNAKETATAKTALPPVRWRVYQP